MPMPLPTLVVPEYECVLPFGQKVTYRPFLVREEKLLYIAMETGDQKEMVKAVKEIIKNCTSVKKVDTLATFDIEYLFLKIRAKSVGEVSEFKLTCPDDGETTVEMEIEIDSIKIQKNKDHKNIIKLDDKYSMKLRYPSFDQFIDNNFEVNDNVSDVNKSLDMITSCIEMV